jgi:hypothetical protein
VAVLRRPSRRPDRETARIALTARVRSTGNQGGRIAPHRALATVRLSRRDVAIAVLLTLAFTALYLASLGAVGDLWTAIFRWLAGPLELGGVARRASPVVSAVSVSVPYFTAPATAPSWAVWWITLVATVAVLVGSLFLRARFLPLAYALRFVAALQATALLFFGLARDRFPYDLAVYIGGMMLIGAAVIGLVPLILGLTFYVMDVRWSQKIALTAIVMGHLLLFVPLQYALQSYVVAHGSLLFLPVGFIVFGILPEVMILIAFYGWGMSWRPGRSRGRRQ